MVRRLLQVSCSYFVFAKIVSLTYSFLVSTAILSAAFPEDAPFMSDEGMLSTPGVEATDSTIAEYVNYSDQLRNKTEWLKQRGKCD